MSLTVPRLLPILRFEGKIITMKKFTRILIVTMGVSLAIVACAKKNHVSTSELQSSFKSAEPALQSQVDKVVSAVKSNNYSEALNDLHVLANKAKLTLDQQQAIKDTMAAVQEQVTDAQKKAATDLQKALGLPK